MLLRVLAPVSLLVALVAAPISVPGPADAVVAADSSPLASATNGIAAAPDGTYWVAQEFADSVVHVSAAGQVIGSPVTVGGSPIDVVAAENGTVWVSVPSAQKLVRLQGGAPNVLNVPTGNCQPVALAAGAGRVFFSSPESGGPGCAAGSLGSVALNGTDLATTAGVFGQVFDLAVSGGKLLAPSYDGDVVRRATLTASPVVESTVDVVPGGNPSGVVVVNGAVWTTLAGTGQLATFPVLQVNGTATTVTPSVPLVSPFGITPSQHGTLYVASKGTHAVADVVPLTGAATAIPLAANAEPFQFAPTPDGLLVTDQARTRLSRIVDAAPTLGQASVTARSAVSATLTVPVDTHGNPTALVVDYGTSAVYGTSVTLAPEAASADGSRTVTVTVPGLQPGKGYHLRLRAQNPRGQAATPDLAVTLPKAPKTTYAASVKGTHTTLTALTVKRLTPGQSITVTCKTAAKGCPFAKKTAKVKKGKAVLGKLFKRHPLAAGAKVSVQVREDGAKVSTLVLKIRDGRPPKATRS